VRKEAAEEVKEKNRQIEELNQIGKEYEGKLTKLSH
jgi:hypothetical protein